MAGASALHNRVALNIAARFLEAARPRGCRVYMSDMKLRIRDEAVYYPDVMVVCGEGPPHPYYEEAPVLWWRSSPRHRGLGPQGETGHVPESG